MNFRIALNRCKIIAIVLLITTLQTITQAQDGERLFQQKCATCHTIGDDILIGPDLIGINDKHDQSWLISFIASSKAMIESGDEAAVKIFKEFMEKDMPDPGMTEPEIIAVLDYIKKLSHGNATAANSPSSNDQDQSSANVGSGSEMDVKLPTKIVEDIVLTDNDLSEGKKLFIGQKRFDAKGPACISCHHIRNDSILLGGSLAKEISTSYSRYKDKGLKGMLKNPPFPVMTAAYKNKPLTEKEIAQVIMFLKKSDEEYVYQHPRNSQNRFLYTAIIGVLVMFGVLPLIWQKKKIRK